MGHGKRILEVRGLIKAYKGRVVVDRVDIDVRTGETAGLLGPNGAGKTTVFYMMAGLVKPDEGAVFLDGVDITDMPLSARARTGIAYLPQERSVFHGLTVQKNIDAVLEMRPGIGRQQQIERREMLLQEFDLKDVESSMGCELSGGEARRLEIARALAIEPSFILLDEPFAGVDPIAVSTIQEIICRLRASGIGILISDHNVRETLKVCDRAFILNQGKVLEAGTPQHIASSPAARAVYLGEGFSL